MFRLYLWLDTTVYKNVVNVTTCRECTTGTGAGTGPVPVPGLDRLPAAGTHVLRPHLAGCSGIQYNGDVRGVRAVRKVDHSLGLAWRYRWMDGDRDIHEMEARRLPLLLALLVSWT